MTKLSAQLRRLFGRPGQVFPDPWPETGSAVELTGPGEQVWTLVMEIAPAAGWQPVAEIWHGVQSDLELPAPVLSLAGEAGFRLWFPLGDAEPWARTRRFLDALRRRYLPEVAEAWVKCLPASPGLCAVPLAPAREGHAERWTAFIDPGMGSMFLDGAWLDMAPNLDKQADLLANFQSIPAAAFERALAMLDPGGAMVPAAAGAVTALQGSSPLWPERSSSGGLGVGSGFVDPRSFLLAVMNDPTASADHRIDAAKALLPYFEG